MKHTIALSWRNRPSGRFLPKRPRRPRVAVALVPGPRARFWLAVTALLAVAVGYLAGFWRAGQPAALPDVPHGKVACLSYTPRGVVPGSDSYVSAAQIEADLALLAPETDCVRTYSSTRGMEAVPEIAGRHGLTVLLGLWIGRDAESNEAEIAAALETARTHPDVIDGIIVGNEVLLRHEQSVESLAAYIARVNAATDEPVTYADVWEFWRTGAALADVVDFVTIHILPYWENDPVGVAAALAHVREIHAEMQAEFPGKRLIIGETGWPTQGRQREGARPGLVNAARFLREFIAWANAEGLSYNVIEAFDQPWKRGSEGTVGGYWGLFDIEGRPKFPLAGPVVEDPHWHRGLALAAILLVLAPLAGRFAAGLRGWRAHLLMALTGLAAGAALYAQWRYVPGANRDAVEFAQTAAALACGWLLVLGLAPRLAAACGPGAAHGNAPLGLIGGIEALRATGVDSTTRLLSVLRLALLFGVAYVCLGLALDARYRDFPLAITALPALLLALQQCFAAGRDRSGIEERMLAAIIVACALASAFVEGPQNLRALTWIGSCLLLGGATLYAAGAQPREGQGREQHAGAGRVEAV